MAFLIALAVRPPAPEPLPPPSRPGSGKSDKPLGSSGLSSVGSGVEGPPPNAETDAAAISPRFIPAF